MQSFPDHFQETPYQRDIMLAEERQRIFNLVTTGQEFTLGFEARQLMIELHHRFPSTFQMFKELVSGMDNQPTGEYQWTTIGQEELSSGFIPPSAAIFRVKNWI